MSQRAPADAAKIIEVVNAAYLQRIAQDAAQAYVNRASGQTREVALEEFERGFREKLAMWDLVVDRIRGVMEP